MTILLFTIILLFSFFSSMDHNIKKYLSIVTQHLKIYLINNCNEEYEFFFYYYIILFTCIILFEINIKIILIIKIIFQLLIIKKQALYYNYYSPLDIYKPTTYS